LGNEESPENLWICLHGYGQQARYFVPRLKALDNGKNLIIVPEALNRFYLSGYNGRVGATWMTSDDREKDIQDNHRYLNELLNVVLDKLENKKLTINLFAFSQGIATACRWMADTTYRFSNSILWAGSLPPDLDWKQNAEIFRQQNIHYVFGNRDEFFDSDKIKSNEVCFKQNQIAYQLVTFDGKHEVNDLVLQNILNGTGNK
jgi:predicted esterase